MLFTCQTRVLILLLSSALVACSGGSNEPSQSADNDDDLSTLNNDPIVDLNTDIVENSENIEPLLVDRDWALTSFVSTDGVVQLHSNEDDFSFTLRFIKSDNADGSVRRAIEGDVVCNGYAAEYTLDSTILSLFGSETTTGDCERVGEDPSASFNRVLLANEASTMLSVQDGVLEILAGSNEKLVFKNSPDNMESNQNPLWTDNSSIAQLYILDPGEFDSTNSESPEPVATISDENITAELDRALRETDVLPNPEGPFLACTPEPNQQNFYLTIEDNNSGLQRYAVNHTCGGLGHGFPGQTGFFQQPLEGRLSIESFCAISALSGVTSTSCD